MKNNFYCLLLGSAFVCVQGFVNPLKAIEPDIIITANKVEVDSKKVASSVTVIDSNEIEKSKESNLLNLLRRIPGVEINQSGGAGRLSNIFIRGSNSNQVLILYNGIRLNSSTTGAFDLSDIKTENIEKIEILRGSHSVIYGSEAIGGVVNIISKKKNFSKKLKSENFDLKVSSGSLETQNYTSTAGINRKGVSSNNSISLLDTEGISAASELRGNKENDSYRNVNFSSSNIFDLSDTTHLDLIYLYNKSEAELDGFDFGVGPVDDPNYIQKRELNTAKVGLNTVISNIISSKTNLKLSEESLKGLDPDTDFNNFKIFSRNYSVDSNLIFNFNDYFNSLFGFEYEVREGSNLSNFDKSRNVRSFFLDNRIDLLSDLYLNLGIRNDRDSIFGDKTTYRTGVSYVMSNVSSRLHSSFGTGFRAPNFNELYFPMFSNPNLNPETSASWDIGIEKTLLEGDLLIDISYFHSDFRNLIVSDSLTFIPDNIDSARAYGIEADLKYYSSFADFTANYTFSEADNKTTQQRLARRPKHKFNFSVSKSFFDSFNAFIQLLVVNNRVDSDQTLMDNYEKVDLNFEYVVSRDLLTFIKLENLFNQKYEEVTGFTSNRFYVLAGFKVDFI